MLGLCDAAEARHGLNPACERSGTGWRLRRKPRLVWVDDPLESLGLAWARGPPAATAGRDPRLGPSDRAGGRRLVLAGAFSPGRVSSVTDRRDHQGRSAGTLSPTEQSPTLTGCGSSSGRGERHRRSWPTPAASSISNAVGNICHRASAIRCRNVARLSQRGRQGARYPRPMADAGQAGATTAPSLRLTQRPNENKKET